MMERRRYDSVKVQSPLLRKKSKYEPHQGKQEKNRRKIRMLWEKK